MTSLKCTHCGAALKLASAPAPGKKIKCSKCGKAFVVPEDEDEPVAEEEAAAEEAEEEEEAAPKAKKSAKPAADEDEDEETDDDEDAPRKPGKKDAKAGKKKGGAKDENGEPKKKSSTGLILGLVGGGVGLVLLCCCGGGGACLMTGELKDGKFGVERDKPEKPLVKTNAEDLAKELIADDPAFKKKYSPRKVEVSGEVREVHLDHFTLQGAKKDEKDPFGVNPSITLKNKEKALRLGKGQKVKVTGLCQSQMRNSIHIYDAEFTLDGPKTIIEINAADLAKDYETNVNAADGKYKDKDLIVTGPIAQLELANRIARLKGTAKTEVAFFLMGEPDIYKDLKVGQQVELRGRLQMYYKDQNSIGVESAMMVKGK